MQLPLQITFHGMDASDTIEAQIRQRADELRHFYDRIMACRVVVESAHRHQRKGRIHHIRIELAVPGGEIVVNRDPPEHHAHEDMQVAIRDAFDAARRQLEDHVRRLRGQTKTHDLPEHGKIAKLFPQQGYGFIAAADGEEIYMHRNSVLHEAFDKLHIGDEVRYVVQSGEGEKGPQASTVIALAHRPPAPR